jgi:hypothetical protein
MKMMMKAKKQEDKLRFKKPKENRKNKIENKLGIEPNKMKPINKSRTKKKIWPQKTYLKNILMT